MTDDKPIDLPAVRRERRKLDRLAKEHPRLVGEPEPGGVDQWEQILEGDEQATGGKDVRRLSDND